MCHKIHKKNIQTPYVTSRMRGRSVCKVLSCCVQIPAVEDKLFILLHQCGLSMGSRDPLGAHPASENALSELIRGINLSMILPYKY